MDSTALPNFACDSDPGADAYPHAAPNTHTHPLTHTDFGRPTERPRLSAYARYRIMLLHVIQRHAADARTVYETLLDKFPEGTAGYAYAELATAFWTEYEASQNIAAACGDAIEYVSAQTDEILKPLGSAAYGPDYPDYLPGDICPFK